MTSIRTFHDLDARYLLRYLNVSNRQEALATVLRSFDEEHIPPKARMAFEEPAAWIGP